MGAQKGSKAASEAARAEGWRTSNINRAVGQINDIYGSASRQAGIDDFLGATRSFYTNELERQKGVADRSLKFAMARSGLSGGSAAADANRTLGEDYQRGVLSAERLAQGAVSDLRNADEAARQNLIAQAGSGLSLTGGASQAASALRNNLQAAQGSLKTDALGDVFGGLSDVYRRSRESAADRRGFRDVYGLLYQPGFGAGGTR
ncbi:hypothetical protein [Stenotrophomonas maltophilia]|uniref:hypothetical protein n=1 Tax=Stenotrophomonas maltophilia TaxID=40324 RepID=UPI000D0BCFF7|nr:hypothetical protein [Stenotrophomonas maltophilia]AVO29857.1 hypothetical protein C6Y55_07900 [Stenotrophomonas maltophilia]